MLLQPDLVRLLTERPVLAIQSPEEGCLSRDNILDDPRRESEEINPLRFTPQLLRLHRDHELFEDGDVQRHMYLQDLYVPEAEEKSTLGVSAFACHISGCSSSFGLLEEYEHHYNSLHRHSCCVCRRSLPSARLLDIHIQEWHDSLFTILAQRQDMYQCLVEGCGLKFSSSKHRKDHLVKIHKYPPDFRFDKPKKDKGTQDLKRQQQLKDSAAMDVAEDVCESEGVCEVMCDAPEHTAVSMETHLSEEQTAADDITQSVSTEGNAETHTPRYSYRIPTNVCFGHGSVRGFRGRRGRRK